MICMQRFCGKRLEAKRDSEMMSYDRSVVFG